MKAITQQMIVDGDIYVEVYPMVEDKEGFRLIEGRHETPETYDVILRPDYLDGDIYGEWEDLTLEEASKQVEELEKQYPGITVNWIQP